MHRGCPQRSRCRFRRADNITTRGQTAPAPSCGCPGMLRPLLAITAAFGVAVGCITPAKVAMVERDMVERDMVDGGEREPAFVESHAPLTERPSHSLSPAIIAPVPEVVAVPLETFVAPPQPAPPE